jgi:hypothetical protein
VSKTSTPVPAGLSYTPRGMHAVRQRWIRQKKAATMDAQAMREVWSDTDILISFLLTCLQIFMIKTPS